MDVKGSIRVVKRKKKAVIWMLFSTALLCFSHGVKAAAHRQIPGLKGALYGMQVPGMGKETMQEMAEVRATRIKR